MTAPHLTEAQVLEMLRQRHVRAGNGGAGEYAFMAHVRNGAAFQSTRTFDAVVMNLWPSRGLTLHAYEIKCSRSDWLRELKDPAKAEAAAAECDQFSVVAADSTIVQEGELPTTWGLLVVKKAKLVCVKEAPILPAAEPTRPVDRSFLVAMLRAVGAVPVPEAAEIAAARRKGYSEGLESGQSQVESAQEALRRLQAIVGEFERTAGFAIHDRYGWRDHAPAEVGTLVNSILTGESRAAQSQDRITRARDELQRAAEALTPFIVSTGDEA